MKTTKDYIVTEGTEQGSYKIYDRDDFELMPYCKTYDRHGVEMWNYFGDEDEDQLEVYACNYFDGSNWQTVIIDDGVNEGEVELDDIEANKILSEMPDFPSFEGTDESIEIENYTFYFSHYPSAEICSVYYEND